MSAADVHIRRARADDLAALMALESAVFDSDRLSQRQWRHHLTNPSAAVLLACAQQHLLGSLLLLFRRGLDSARIYSIATAPAARGQGIAGALLDEAELLAISRGCTRLRLEVRRDNPAAQRLYLRHGYHLIGERANYYADGMDALRYEKSLVITLP